MSKMPKIKAIIFDMDGVIVDTEPLNDKHMAVFLQRYNITVTENFFERFRGTSSTTIWSSIIEEFKLTQPIDMLIADSRKSYLEYLKRSPEFKITRGLKSLLQRLRTAGFTLAVASSAYKKRVEITLSRFNIDKMFEVVISADDVKQSKPDPQIYLLTAQLLQLHPNQCVVIEDATNGVLAAKNAGMKVIGYQGMPHNTQDLSMANVVIKKFQDITPLFLEQL